MKEEKRTLIETNADLSKEIGGIQHFCVMEITDEYGEKVYLDKITGKERARIFEAVNNEAERENASGNLLGPFKVCVKINGKVFNVTQRDRICRVISNNTWQEVKIEEPGNENIPN